MAFLRSVLLHLLLNPIQILNLTPMFVVPLVALFLVFLLLHIQVLEMQKQMVKNTFGYHKDIIISESHTFFLYLSSSDQLWNLE
jgi:hypothetical protein